MPSGMQIFGADGSLQVDTGTRLSRVIGSMEVNPPIFQTLTMAWPYPSIPGDRLVLTVSKNTPNPNENSFAFAYYNPANGLVYYHKGEDTGPITLLFMVY